MIIWLSTKNSRHIKVNSVCIALKCYSTVKNDVLPGLLPWELWNIVRAIHFSDKNKFSLLLVYQEPAQLWEKSRNFFLPVYQTIIFQVFSEFLLCILLEISGIAEMSLRASFEDNGIAQITLDNCNLFCKTFTKGACMHEGKNSAWLSFSQVELAKRIVGEGIGHMFLPIYLLWRHWMMRSRAPQQTVAFQNKNEF